MWSYIWLAVALIVEGGLVLKFVSQLIDRDITWVEFIGYLVGLTVATAIMVTYREIVIGPAVGLSVLAFTLLQGAVNNLINQSLISAMRADDVRRAEEVLKARKDIPDAYITIGDVLFERGLYSQALNYYKQALDIQVRDAETEWKLKYCQDALRRQRERLQVCPQCLLECPRSERTCPRCGHYLGMRVTKMVGAHAPFLGGLLLLAGLGALVWLVVLAARPLPILGAVAAVPFIAVLIVKRHSLAAVLRRPAKE